MASLTAFAQYPTTKTIKGQEVVIMTVPQAKAIDEKFVSLKDSIKLLNSSLYQNKDSLKTANKNLAIVTLDLTKTNVSLLTTQESLNRITIQNEEYLKEIERYKKMEFEDKRVARRTAIGFATVAVFWVLYVVSAMSQ